MADPEGGQGSRLSRDEQWNCLERMVMDHHKEVYAYLFRLCGSAADVEDLTQQTFLAACECIDQLREPAKGRAWLLSIARSRFLKWIRKRGPITATDGDVDLEHFDDQLPKGDQIDGERLQQAMNQLPSAWRVVLTMYYFEQSSYRQIAAQLGLPIGTVMSRLARAKRKLRDLLTARSSRSAVGADISSQTSAACLIKGN